MTAHIDLRHLRYFIAVAEERSFRGAAERLHISQPPLSRQIRQLEEEMGVDLLERGKHGATLTPAGSAFLPAARKTLVQAERAIDAARSAGGGAGGHFVLGYTPVFDRSGTSRISQAIVKVTAHSAAVPSMTPCSPLVTPVRNASRTGSGSPRSIAGVNAWPPARRSPSLPSRPARVSVMRPV